MTSIISLKDFLDVLEKIISIITEARKSSKEEFDQLIGSVYTDIEKVVTAYFDLFSELRFKIAASKTKSDLDNSLNIIRRERDKLVINREGLCGTLFSYANMINNQQKNKNQTKYDFLCFLENIVKFFFSPINDSGPSGDVFYGINTKTYSRCINTLSGVLDSIDNLDFEIAKRDSLEDIDQSMRIMQNYWKAAKYHYGNFTTDKDLLNSLLENRNAVIYQANLSAARRAISRRIGQLTAFVRRVVKKDV